jgi:hypothetical protein
MRILVPVTATGWRPLSSRHKGDAATSWREEVPAALEVPLRTWVRDTLNPRWPGIIGIEPVPERVLLKLDLVLPPDAEDDGSEEIPSRSSLARQSLAWGTPTEQLPDVIDAILHLLPPPHPPVNPSRAPEGAAFGWSALAVVNTAASYQRVIAQRKELAGLLDDALSALRVQADGRGLERRADPVAEAAHAEAVASAGTAANAGSAAAHLRTSWACLHALHPDSGKAYSEAIKAVEAAAHALTEPNNRKATLGSMIGALRSSQHRYPLIIGKNRERDAATLIGMMALLWDGQTSRHGASTETRAETLDEATAAVHLAVTLVQWFTSGAVHRQ